MRKGILEYCRPYSFRICFTDPYQGAIAADLAYNDLKKTKAAILYNVGSDYAHGLRETFRYFLCFRF